MDEIELSAAQQFEIERMSRAIDQTQDIEVLRSIAKETFRAWMIQKSASNWLIKQNMTKQPKFGLSD